MDHDDGLFPTLPPLQPLPLRHHSSRLTIRPTRWCISLDTLSRHAHRVHVLRVCVPFFVEARRGIRCAGRVRRTPCPSVSTDDDGDDGEDTLASSDASECASPVPAPPGADNTYDTNEHFIGKQFPSTLSLPSPSPLSAYVWSRVGLEKGLWQGHGSFFGVFLCGAYPGIVGKEDDLVNDVFTKDGYSLTSSVQRTVFV